jgi:hypothetical protein
MIKLDMREICKERFKKLVYQQRASIRYERVEANNSYVTILIFGSFFLLSFCQVFSRPFSLFNLAFYRLFSFFIWIFIAFYFSLLFRSCFVPIFSLM